jgi:methylglutaconyl-CoA hydratase
MGLVHDVAEPAQLDSQMDELLTNLLAGAPLAQTAAKDLVELVANQPITAALIDETAQRIATIRSQPEAREGLTAFLKKRPAAWVPIR